MRIPLLLFFLLSSFSSAQKHAEAQVLEQPAQAWVNYMSAVLEACRFAMGGDNEGADREEFEDRAKAISEAQAELVKKGELVEKEFTFKSHNALFAPKKPNELLEDFGERALKSFHRDILQEFLGIGFEFQVMIANQRKGQEFDRDAPWKTKVNLPKSLMTEFEKSVSGLLMAKPK